MAPHQSSSASTAAACARDVASVCATTRRPAKPAFAFQRVRSCALHKRERMRACEVRQRLPAARQRLPPRHQRRSALRRVLSSCGLRRSAGCPLQRRHAAETTRHCLRARRARKRCIAGARGRAGVRHISFDTRSNRQFNSRRPQRASAARCAEDEALTSISQPGTPPALTSNLAHTARHNPTPAPLTPSRPSQ
jgi:hypothetical protein